jgi:NAD(P)-dependent dehydrogenase (short-subunit alcohol dehydrogenase family)
MLMSVIEGALSVPAYPELVGKRVLITGVTRHSGIDIARAFAERKGRVILQFAEASAAMQAVAEIVAPDALETRVYGPVASGAEAARFAKSAVQAFGGLDAVINLVPLDAAHVDRAATVDEVEGVIAAQLELPHMVSRIAANRMSVTWTQGLILNVATLTGRRGGAPGGSRGAFAALAKSTLVDLTRAQAEEWAGRGIRFNAIAPETALGEPGPRLCGEADVAALALYLASRHGKTLSGCVFEAAP